MTALGVLVAIAVSFAILALAGAHRTTNPVTASKATAGPVPQIHYLGPRQLRVGLNPLTTQTHTGGTTVTHYTCVPEKYCIP
jgi:hypothetical protein